MLGGEMDPRSLARDVAPPEGYDPLPRGERGDLGDPGLGQPLDAQSSARFRRIFDGNFAFVWRTLRRLGVGEASLPDASQRVFWAEARRLDEVSDERMRAFLFGTSRR